jgi:hypothetical protein
MGKPKLKEHVNDKDIECKLPELKSIEQIKIPDPWLIHNVIPVVLKNKYIWETEDLLRLIRKLRAHLAKRQLQNERLKLTV